MKGVHLRDVRTRLLVIVVAATALGLVAATAGFNSLLEAMSQREVNALVRQRAASERSLLRVDGSTIRVVDGPGDRVADKRVWIFEGTRAMQVPPGHPELGEAARALAVGPSRYVTLSTFQRRMYSLPVLADDGRRVGTIVVTASLVPYENTERIALTASIAFAACLLLLVAGIAWWLLRSALRPVALMTAQAGAWIDGDLEGRFRIGEPHDELTRLAWTLDQLLDRIAASLRHERLLSAELSHELRTPLARLRAEAELALRRPRTQSDYAEALRSVIAQADGIDRIVNALLAAAREEGPRGVCDSAEVLVAAVDACAPLAANAGIELEIVESAPIDVGVDGALAERVLHPVLDNACRYAHRHVRITSTREDGAVLFTVSDDGPGVLAEERETIFQPATRGSAGRATAGGAGLGLALARRLSRSVGGDVEVADGGFVVRLPVA